MKKYYILILCLLSFACSYTNEERCLRNIPLEPAGLDSFITQTLETKNLQFYDCLKKTDLIDQKQSLVLALRFQDAEAIKKILDSLQPLAYMATFQNSPEIIQAFNSLDIEVDAFWPSTKYAQQVLLAIAIDSDNLKAVKQIIEKGASIYLDIDGKYPINIAAFKGNLPIVKFLIEKGADVTVRDQLSPKGNVLYYAISSGSPELVKFLLNQGKIKANSDIGTRWDKYHMEFSVTPLETAIYYDKLEIARLLLQNHAHPNQLCLALEQNRSDIAKLLIQYHANINAICRREGVGTEGVTPLDLAYSNSDDELIKILLNKKAKHYKEITVKDLLNTMLAF